MTEPPGTFSRFRRVFWQPPRAHGEVIEDRTVSFLELFYDLVFVVVIARATHTLAAHLSWEGVFEFSVIFGLIWIAWLNGTVYYDLHGREEGRTRTFVFGQMLLLALIAVFIEHAADTSGREFALAYLAFLLLMSALWYGVRRRDTPEFEAVTRRYLVGMLASALVIAVSTPLPEDARVVLWAILVAGWVIGTLLLAAMTTGEETPFRIRAEDSLVERFGLFTIIVLGEVVVGVVTGISEADHEFRTVATGMLALTIAFGLWWTYFDFAGRRRPLHEGTNVARWVLSHLPLTLAIAASGAATVTLIEHGADDAAPANAAWVLTGAVATVLGSLILTTLTLEDERRFPSIYRPLQVMLALGAVAALAVGQWRPEPWLLVLSLQAILIAVWGVAVWRWMQLDDPASALPDGAN